MTPVEPAASQAIRPTPESARPVLPKDAIAVLPVRNMVLFPGQVVPITVGRDRSIAAANHALQQDQEIGILLQHDAQAEVPEPADLAGIGTLACVLRHVVTPDLTHHIVCQGQQRFRVLEFLPGHPFLVARIERLGEAVSNGNHHIEARTLQLRARALEALEMLPQTAEETLNAVRHIEAPERLTDTVAGYLDLKASEKQEVLELLDLRQRMDRLLVLLGHRIEVMRISQDIEQHTRVSLDRREREFLLREQMKSIQRELGENGGHGDAELQELRQRLKAAELPEEAARLADKELRRLERMPESSAEQAMVRNHLDWLCELPWTAPAADRIDLAQAREQLDAEHFGMDKVKQRILEFLAVRQLKPDGQGPILCLMGPPGVGKTSLGQSIARALGRPLVRVSLGGLHDEAEIRGHRRTYIGALPGRILQALRKAGTRGCVMLLDEIDKLGAGAQGDPAAALLEVLDPQQNSSFRDNYLAVACDLSPVLFITTANLPDPIPGALRDRLEVIQLAGYTAEEKLQIAQRHLVQRQRAACGLETGQLDLPPETLLTLIRHYTREAGVRNLERQIGALCRQAAVHFASGGQEPVQVRPADLPRRLGPPPFENEVALRMGLPGVATGLAWTSTGGDILFIEACLTSGTGRLILTGQLGEVMKESAQAALTLVKSRALALGVDASRLERADLHLHVPAGAIPKDGPSAGVALFIAIASLLLGKPVRSDLAMTGEISLRGLVLPVGGIREKVLAARAAGLRRVLLPSRNRKDLQDLPDPVRQDLVFVLLEDVDEALREALAPSQAPAAGDTLACASPVLQGNGPAVTLEQPGGAAC